MASTSNTRVPEGSTIFVTGVTGYIGSWVAHEALALGFNVRGSVRSLEKAGWLQAHFDSKFPGRYSQVLLPDLSDEASLKAAIKGVAGIAHVAVNTELSTDPEPYIPQLVEETINLLKIAEEEPAVKSVVLTSSSLAGVAWGAKGKIAKDTYNEEFIKLAWDPAFEHPAKKFIVYAAAKAQAEKAVWKYVEDEKPHYALNTILPNCNFGPSLVYGKQGHPSTGGWAKELFDGNVSAVTDVPPQYFIDVRDNAKLHIAALVKSTPNDRLWGFAEPFNWNTVLAIFRKLWPEKTFPDDITGLGWDESTLPTESALEALKEVYGQSGWTSLETTLKEAGYERESVEAASQKKLNAN